VAKLGIKSVAGTPLKYEGNTIGALTVASTKQKNISGDDRSLISYMSNLITTAVVKSQLYGAERESRIRLSALEDISEAGLTTLGMDELLNEIADRIVKNLNINWAGIILFENKNGETVVEHASDGCSTIKGRSLNNGCSIMKEILEEGKSRVLKKNCIDQVKPHMSCHGIRAMMLVPVTLRHDWACMIGVGKKKNATFTEKEMGLVETISQRSAIAIENTLLFARLEDSYLQTIESLVRAIEAKDRYTCGHSECVAVLGKEIAIEMGVDERTAERVYVAGLLHDIGKIGIPSHILLKPTKLSLEDYDEIKLHPTKGCQILKPIRSLDNLAEVVLQHHERYDGTGYPNGLKGEEILLEARILAVADAYQAMISDRPYRKRLPFEEAIIELEKDTGTQFDPEVTNAFFSIIKKQIRSHEEEIEEKVEDEDFEESSKTSFMGK